MRSWDGTPLWVHEGVLACDLAAWSWLWERELQVREAAVRGLPPLEARALAGVIETLRAACDLARLYAHGQVELLLAGRGVSSCPGYAASGSALLVFSPGVLAHALGPPWRLEVDVL